jgi:triosephosphate isomerase (TIM)
MRTPIVAGNWKMNTTIAEAGKLVNKIKGTLNLSENIEVIVCPPYISLFTVKQSLKDSPIEIGAQNMYFEENGAFTGEISPVMLSDICNYVILGHSERRQYFGEVDEIVNRKIRTALKHRLKPIICVGEKLEEKNSGKTEGILVKQIEQGLHDIQSNPDIVVAYEPLWAIGTGKAANGEQSNATIEFIRGIIEKIWGKNIAQAIRILYGGSVKSSNTMEFISQPNIDGVLVGGASLNADEFLGIVNQTADYQNRKIAKGLN